MIDVNNNNLKGRVAASNVGILIDMKNLSVECAKALCEGVLILALLCGSETGVVGERTRLRSDQIRNLRGIPGMRRMDKMRNERIQDVVWLMESMLRWYDHKMRIYKILVS